MTGDDAKSARPPLDRDGGFRLLFANNPLPMWVYDVATLYFLEVNDAAVAYYGYRREEFLRMRVTEITPPEDVAVVTETVARLAADASRTLRRHERTWRHRLKDGRLRDVEATSHAIEFAGRQASLVVFHDVTDVKQAEAERASYAERLRLLHEIDAAIIAAEAPAAIAEAVLPRLRDLLGVPRAIVNLFDLEAGEVEWLAAVGRRRLRVGPGVRFPLRLMGDVEALRRGELQTIDTRTLPKSPETEALQASGVVTYMVVPMLVAGELIGAVSFGGPGHDFPAEQIGIAREVAGQLAIALQQARLHERVKRQAAELEIRVEARTLELTMANDRLNSEIAERRRAELEADRANQAKSEFLSRMSHELRTPLNGVLGFAQLLQLGPLDPGQTECVEHILKGGRHLLTLINEILDIAGIEAGRLPISIEPVGVSDVLVAALDLVRPQAAARRVRLANHVTGDLHVAADRSRLRQVLLNLLSNGVKYNREGGTVTITAERAASDRVRIAVADTGTGIATEMLGRLFTPFDRLDADLKGIEGTGLGLALSKRLVEAMGGEVSVGSRPGDGTTFTVELAVAEIPAMLAPAAEAAVDDAPTPQTRGTVLYIEDNVANLRLMERLVTRRPGVTLLSAMQGSQGVEIARSHAPDAIVLDLHLPDVSGEDVLTLLRDDARTRDIPVVMLSADATPKQLSRLLARGAHAYLTKPLDVAEMLATLDDLLSR